MRSVSPSRMEIENFNEEDDIMIVEEPSVSAHDSRSKPSSSASAFKINKYASEFRNDFDNCEIIVNTEKSRRFSSLYFFSFFYVILC